jgi:hypothetical protein
MDDMAKPPTIVHFIILKHVRQQRIGLLRYRKARLITIVSKDQ